MQLFLNKTRRKKMSTGVVSVFVTTMMVVLLMLPAGSAYAIPVFDPNQAVATTLQIEGKVQASIGAALTAAGMNALMQGVNYFTKKLAYDAALALAYGGEGKGSLGFLDSPGDYFASVAGDALGEAVGELGKPFGLNLCQVPNLNVQLYFQIGIRSFYNEGPKPNCTWQQLTEGGIFSLDAWTDRYGTSKGLSESFSGNFSLSNTDLGVGLGAIAQVDQNRAEAEKGAEIERLLGQGFKDVKGLISGNIKTPSSVIAEESKQLTSKHKGEITAGQVAGLYASTDVLTSILATAGSVFLNTLTSSLLDRLINEGLFPEKGRQDDASFVTTPFGGSTYSGTRRPFEKPLRKLLAHIPGRSDDFDPVIGWAACPNNPGLNNCVIDSQLQQLLVRSRIVDQRLLSIKEAMEEGFLDPNRPLISPRDGLHGQKDRCQNDLYCYSNIQKLRKMRVLPLGFEIAALRSPPDNPWKLGEVVAGFEKCELSVEGDPTTVEPSGNFPFCHLINPNWVVTVPPAICEAQVFGPQLAQVGAPIRREECVDAPTCLQKDANGNCVTDGFGYCTQESNVWGIEGEQCDAYYATCTTYTNTESNKVDSMLSRTVDFGQCNQDTVGCRAYITDRINQNDQEWKVSAEYADDARGQRSVGNNGVLYFDKDIASASANCGPGNKGCTAFKTAAVSALNNTLFEVDSNNFYQQTDTLEYLKKAPDYLGCYDVNSDVLGNQWPTTEQEVLSQVSNAPGCSDYASVCIADEVGCRGYNPVDGGATIPGIVGEDLVCNEQCVGYDTYKQLGFEETGKGFEEEQFPLYFVPAIAYSNMSARDLTCNEAVVGCDEFTNLDAQQAGGESLEYYTRIKHCERPAADESNQAPFYTWEGSAIEGFVLRTHTLRPTTQNDVEYYLTIFDNEDGIDGLRLADRAEGKPRYATDQQDELLALAKECNVEAYERKIAGEQGAAPENCKAIYDEAGNVSYRMIDQLITVSPSCAFLRKTQADIVVDEFITSDGSPAMCIERGGSWEGGVDGECQRCANGGTLEGGVCIYSAMVGFGESTSCSPQANGCRAYTGNRAGNVQQMFPQREEDFEVQGEVDEDALNAARENWLPQAGLSVSGEATDVSLHSLQIDVPLAYYNFATSSARFSDRTFYNVSFWAKGTGQNISLFLSQNANDPIGEARFVDAVSIGAAWQRYEFGPVEIVGVNEEIPTQLVFERQGGGTYFIDHVQLTRIAEREYVIKDSWKTIDPDTGSFVDAPLACDRQPFDGLPGEALGCRAYESDGQNHFATGFDRLCRAQAIGCEPVWDTYNTINTKDPELAHVYNVRCEGPENLPCTVGNQVNGEPFSTESCKPLVGQTHCYIPEIILPASIGFADLVGEGYTDVSTIHIPADTASTTPMFLTNTENDRCRGGASALGCTEVGRETQVLPLVEDGVLARRSFEHTTTFVKNDPASYEDTLCQQRVSACTAFSHQNGVSFFKDPELTGSKKCTYVPENEESARYGWYANNIGFCEGTQGQCRSEVDCAENVSCENVGRAVACSPDNLQRGGEYEIWSSGSENYDGYVGMCPSQYNTCSEFVDHAGTSNANPDGKPYYFLFDSTFKQNLSRCEGVSLTEGCVLLDKTDLPNKSFSSVASYEASKIKEGDSYGSVDPISIEGENDANLLLKVRRDRECSQWLSCRSTQLVRDPESGDERELCHQFQACQALNEDGTCADWVGEVGNNEERARAVSPLSYSKYIKRGTSWFDDEFTGYSLFGQHQITDLTYIAFHGSRGLEEKMDGYFNRTYLVRKLSPELSEQLQPDIGEEFLGCDPAERQGVDNTDWYSCGPLLGGMCFSNNCYYPTTGVFRTKVQEKGEVGNELVTKSNQIKAVLNELTGSSCKVIPENDSPFPFEVIDERGDNLRHETSINPGYRQEFVQLDAPYIGANVCQDGNCTCSYDKVEYKNGVTDYWPTGSSAAGICSNADNEGEPCAGDIHCEGESATCSFKKDVEQHIGIQGFCLEPDYSRPLRQNANPYACLTWLPTQASVSAGDIYNAHVNAGYNPDEDALGGGEVYCTAATNPHYSPPNSLYNEAYVQANPQGALGSWNILENNYEEHYSALQLAQPPDDAGDPHRIIGPWYTRMYLQSRNAAWWDAVLLRFDIDADGSNADAGTSATFGVARRAGRDVIYAFAPESASDIEFGTQVHPPRLFDDLPYYPTNEFPYSQTVAMSPEFNRFVDPVDSVLKRLQHSIYVTPYEKYINEEELVKVFFKPQYTLKGFKEVQIFGEVQNILGGNILGKYNVAGDEAPELTTPVEIDFEKLRDLGHMAVLTQEQEGLELDSIVWSYYLTNEKGSEHTLDGFSYIENAEVGYDYDVDRNIIHSRYVSVFSDYNGENQNEMPTWIPVGELLDENVEISFGLELPSRMPEVANDPFGVPCAGSPSPFFAIGMDFNQAGEFLGYISRYCPEAGSGGEDSGFPLVTFAELRSSCRQVDVVHEVVPGRSLLTATANKAWTNRVWKGASRLSGDDLAHAKFPSPRYDEIRRDTPGQPYGSLPVLSGSIRDAESVFLSLIRTAFYDPGHGVPLKCDKTVNGYARTVVPPREYTYCGLPGKEIILNQPLVIPRLYEQLNARSRDASNPREALHEIFAKSMRVATLDYTISNAVQLFPETDESVVLPGVDLDESQSLNPQPLPPRIFSTNPFTCGLNSRNCGAAEENHFTINGKNMMFDDVDYGEATGPDGERDRNVDFDLDGLPDYNGDFLPDEDVDGDGEPDPIVEVGTYHAVASFFAFADSNHMPIRRVMINWGDGEDGIVPRLHEGPVGLYKNFMPVCERTNSPGFTSIGHCSLFGDDSIGLTCSSDVACPSGYKCSYRDEEHNREDDIKKFGELPRACFPGFYKASHEYKCEEEELNSGEDFVKEVNSLTPVERAAVFAVAPDLTVDSDVCVYQPGVQVLDNWGWCNGSCGLAADDFTNVGCYDDIRDPQRELKLCSNPNLFDRAFTKFGNGKGKIIVVPKFDE